MKTFAVATVIAMASVATAQFDNIPQCAVSCFVTPLTTDGCSALTDFKCHCEKSDSLFASVTPCVEKGCSAEEVSTVISEVEKICAENGVTVKVPTPGGSSTPAPSAAESTPAPSSAPAETEAESTGAPAPTDKPTGYPTAGTSAAPTGGNATISTGAPSTEFTGAAALPTAAGVLGAAALALLAL